MRIEYQPKLFCNITQRYIYIDPEYGIRILPYNLLKSIQNYDRKQLNKINNYSTHYYKQKLIEELNSLNKFGLRLSKLVLFSKQELSDIIINEISQIHTDCDRYIISLNRLDLYNINSDIIRNKSNYLSDIFLYDVSELKHKYNRYQDSILEFLPEQFKTNTYNSLFNELIHFDKSHLNKVILFENKPFLREPKITNLYYYYDSSDSDSESYSSYTSCSGDDLSEDDEINIHSNSEDDEISIHSNSEYDSEDDELSLDYESEILEKALKLCYKNSKKIEYLNKTIELQERHIKQQEKLIDMFFELLK